MNNCEKYEHHPAMQILRAAIRKEWRIKAVAGLISFCIGFQLCFHFFAKNSILVIIGLVLFLMGMRLGWQCLKEHMQGNNVLLNFLCHRPNEIVWVYSLITQRMPFGFEFSKNGLLYLKLLSGDEISLNMPAVQLRLVSKFLNKLVPHATFGYSKEKERLYRENPAMLMRNPSSKKSGDDFESPPDS